MSRGWQIGEKPAHFGRILDLRTVPAVTEHDKSRRGHGVEQRRSAFERREPIPGTPDQEHRDPDLVEYERVGPTVGTQGEQVAPDPAQIPHAANM